MIATILMPLALFLGIALLNIFAGLFLFGSAMGRAMALLYGVAGVVLCAMLLASAVTQ